MNVTWDPHAHTIEQQQLQQKQLKLNTPIRFTIAYLWILAQNNSDVYYTVNAVIQYNLSNRELFIVCRYVFLYDKYI